MNKILAIIIAIGLFFLYKYDSNKQAQEYIPPTEQINIPEQNTESTQSNNISKIYISYKKPSNKIQITFHCDGRKYCSQMNSYEEATYFLNNCPDPRMDGNHDGIPCEKQWCN